MADQVASKVIFYNNGGFECNFSVQWDGGETNRTSETYNLQSATIDLNQVTNIPEGASCCARAYIAAGVNHNSGRNFTYSKSSTDTVEYTITGTTLNPSFD